MPGSDPWAGQQPPGPPPGYQPPPGPPPAGQPPGGQPPGWGQPEPMWQPPPAFPLAPDAYPVNISYDREAPINRLWGIPLIGQLVRAILAIPHYIVLFLLALVALLQFLVSWIVVLVMGRYPGWGYRWTGGMLAYSQRVTAYVLLMTPAYPPFALQAEMYPISVRFDEGVRINRLWGIPVIGYLVRWLILIPHYLVLWLLGFVAGFLVLFAWVPVLILGRQADLIYTIVGGTYRWYLRVSAYALLMVDKYPPFSLGEDDPRL
ncbi:MAG: DUF4389 domain-containing protein [Nannocystaceae bacterium]